MISAVPARDRRREYWSWAAGALYILLTLDLITTLYAASIYGPSAEANPWMRWALQEGVETLVLVNLAALVVLAILFYGMIELTVRAPERYQQSIALTFEVWLALVLAVGLVVFANNLSVIILGENLDLTLHAGIAGNITT